MELFPIGHPMPYGFFCACPHCPSFHNTIFYRIPQKRAKSVNKSQIQAFPKIHTCVIIRLFKIMDPIQGMGPKKGCEAYGGEGGR